MLRGLEHVEQVNNVSVLGQGCMNDHLVLLDSHFILCQLVLAETLERVERS